MSDEDTGAEATISDQTELDTLREGIDDPMVLKGQLAKEAEARRQITARAIKAENELKELRNKPVVQETAAPDIKPDTMDTDAKIWEVAGLIREGYTKQDAEFLQANGGQEALKDPNSYASIALKAVTEQRRAEQAAAQTDQSGGEDSLRVTSFNLPKNPSVQDLKKSIGDMEKALPHAD